MKHTYENVDIVRKGCFRKNEKGSITLFVLMAMIFFLVIAMSSYAVSMNKLEGQSSQIEQIKANYEQNVNEEDLAQIYEEIIKRK